MHRRNLDSALHDAALTSHPKLDLTRTVARTIFTSQSSPWQALKGIEKQIPAFGVELPYDQYDEIMENVWVHTSAYVSPTAKITSPAIICGGARIGHFSHISGSVIGSFSSVGDSSSIINSILFDKSTLSGHNSINSSIIGYKATAEQGVIISDTSSDRSEIAYNSFSNLEKVKFGAIVCDEVRIGAGCVIKSGSIIDYCSFIPPMTAISGYIRPYANIK